MAGMETKDPAPESFKIVIREKEKPMEKNLFPKLCSITDPTILKKFHDEIEEELKSDHEESENKCEKIRGFRFVFKLENALITWFLEKYIGWDTNLGLNSSFFKDYGPILPFETPDKQPKKQYTKLEELKIQKEYYRLELVGKTYYTTIRYFTNYDPFWYLKIGKLPDFLNFPLKTDR